MGKKLAGWVGELTSQIFPLGKKLGKERVGPFFPQVTKLIGGKTDHYTGVL